MSSNKIFSIHQIKKKIKLIKKEKKKIVLCHGVFDLIHIGHVKYFESAKKNYDYLIVSVTSDIFVNKGPGRPYFNQDLRMQLLSSLEIVNAVVLSDYPTSEKILSTVRPNAYIKGPDYLNNKKDKTKNIYKEIKIVKKYGGEVKYTKDSVYSSSNLLNKFFKSLNDEQRKFIDKISRKYTFQKIEGFLETLKKSYPLLIGETIIDQYIFCDTLGKSGKEPHLAAKDLYTETYLGGSAAIANHLAEFSRTVEFITSIGQKKDFFSFIKKKLKKNIKTNFFLKNNSPTIIKKRFIDEISGSKLLGVYSINDNMVSKQIEKRIISKLNEKIKKTDCVIVSDYGHGLITEKIAKLISKKKSFFALNAQVNAANLGFHSLSKYRNIDALIINESELRHEMRDKNSDIDKLSYQLLSKFKILYLIVTRGKNGVNLYTKKLKKKIHSPAFANKVVDKVGAGDNMLSLISICLQKKIPLDLTLFLGSLAGAQSVESLGNSESLNKFRLLRNLEYLLK